MPAYKDSKTGKWYVQFRNVDWTGKRQQKLKRSFTAKAIGDRVGHESEHITNHYTHLFPSRQTEMADRLNDAREMEQQADSDKGGEEDVEKKAG